MLLESGGKTSVPKTEDVGSSPTGSSFAEIVMAFVIKCDAEILSGHPWELVGDPGFPQLPINLPKEK